MENISKQWFEVQTYWSAGGWSDDEGWVGENTFSTLEDAQEWIKEYEVGKVVRIVQCFVVYKGEVK